ncbi:MAG: guanylate kinase [Deltaproteobacteria bacterium]|nr:guanylate kinase [Deltaproteobacteria bacterium]
MAATAAADASPRAPTGLARTPQATVTPETGQAGPGPESGQADLKPEANQADADDQGRREGARMGREFPMAYSGGLIVLSAPSGSGKSSLIKALLNDPAIGGLAFAVSHTSRNPRPGEVDGKDYHFVSPEEFRAMVDRGEFLEWTETFGRYYGTSRVLIERQLATGLTVIADVDVVGARAIKASFPDARLVFVVPPSFRALTERLAGRNTESKLAARTRLARAAEETAQRDIFDFLIINDDFGEAERELVDIVTKGEGRPVEGPPGFWEGFFE